jgi:site-specific recombinase XerD
MRVIFYKRHNRSCSHKNDRSYRRCDCSIWLELNHNGKQHRESSKTSDWELAEEKAQELRTRFTDKRQTVAPVPGKQGLTVEEAIEKFLLAKSGENLSEGTLYNHRKDGKRLVEFCTKEGVTLITDVTFQLLTEYRAMWDDYYSSVLVKRNVQGRLKEFFRHSVNADWIAKSPAAKLSKIKVKKDEETATQPFTPEEMEKIFGAIPKANLEPETAQRVRTLVLIQRHAGLSIQDGIKVQRKQVIWDGADYRIKIQRTKTGVGINNVIPPWVAKEILATMNGNPKYVLWSGVGKPRSAVSHFQRLYQKVFEAAEIPTGHSHRFRDTSAVELLLAGVSMEDVARFLGNTLAVCERYYGAWNPRRQNKLDEEVRRSWSVGKSAASGS